MRACESFDFASFMSKVLIAAVILGLIFVLNKVINWYKNAKLKIDLNGKYIVVTGCDSGIGYALAQKLSSIYHARVIAFTYLADRLENVSHTIKCDLTKETDIINAVDQVEKILQDNNSELYGVVHNAGVVAAGMIDFMPLNTFRNVMEVNFFAIVSLNQKLMPLLKSKLDNRLNKVGESPRRVVIVTSVDGVVSLPGNAPYDSSKFAAEAFADALRIESSFFNISVSVINPSTLATPLALSFFETERNSYNEYKKINPSGRWRNDWTEDWLNKHIATGTKNIKQIAQDPVHAVNDIINALESKYPKHRYLSGFAAKTIFYLLWSMPEHLAYKIKLGLIDPKPV